MASGSDGLKAIKQALASGTAWLRIVAAKALMWCAWYWPWQNYYRHIAAKATEWYIEQEAVLSRQGRPLTVEEKELARRMGVQHPEKVRVLVLARFPFPDDPMLAKEAEAFAFGSDTEAGRSMGYAVLIKPRFRLARPLLAHELVHVAQRERLGAEGFVRRYLIELKTVGYERSPLEAEANRMMQSTISKSGLSSFRKK